MSFSYEQAVAQADAGMERLFETVPYARAFHTTEAFDPDYYRRHLIECVLRIGMNNELDAFAVSRLVNVNEPAAKEFTYYLYDELNHGSLFLADLRALGLSEAQVATSDTFFSTKLLMGYLRLMVERHGALPAIVWDWFLEYYGARFNGFITAKASGQLGAQATKGASAHLNTDEVEDHAGLMFRLVRKVVETPADEALAREVLARVIELVGQYFAELHAATLLTKQAVA